MHAVAFVRFKTGILFTAVLLFGAGASAQSLTAIGGQTSLQQRTGLFVDTTCNGLVASGVNPGGSSATSDLLRICTDLVSDANTVTGMGGGMGMGMGGGGVGLSGPEINAALADVAHDEAGAFTRIATQTTVSTVKAVQNRLFALRSGNDVFTIAGIRLRDAEGRVMDDAELARALREHSAAGDGVGDQRFGAFVNGLYGFGEFDGNDEETGFDFDSIGIVAGVDYRFSDQFAAGLAFTWSDTENDFDGGNGSLDDDGYGFSIYGTYQIEKLYIDGVFSYNTRDYDLERRLSYTSISRTASADTDGDEWGISIGGGYEFSDDGFTYGPTFRINYLDSDIDGFSESGAGGLNLAIDDQDFESLTINAGGTVAYALSTGFGIVSPYARLEAEVELENDSRTVGARFVADPNANRLIIRTDDGDSFYGNLGVGVAATFPGGGSAFLEFATILGYEDVDAYQITLGGRFEF